MSLPAQQHTNAIREQLMNSVEQLAAKEIDTVFSVSGEQARANGRVNVGLEFGARNITYANQLCLVISHIKIESNAALKRRVSV